LEDAEVNLKMGNQQIAKAILEYVTNNNEFVYCVQRVPALRMQGEFLLDCNAETLNYVQTHNFDNSLKLIDDFVLHRKTLSEKYRDIFEWQQLDAFASKHRTAAYAAMAKYADREYQQLYDYRHSQEYQTLQDIIEQNRQAAEKVTQRENQDRRVLIIPKLRRTLCRLTNPLAVWMLSQGLSIPCAPVWIFLARVAAYPPFCWSQIIWTGPAVNSAWT